MIDRVVSAIIEEVKHLKPGTEKFEEETTAIFNSDLFKNQESNKVMSQSLKDSGIGYKVNTTHAIVHNIFY